MGLIEDQLKRMVKESKTIQEIDAVERLLYSLTPTPNLDISSVKNESPKGFLDIGREVKNTVEKLNELINSSKMKDKEIIGYVLKDEKYLKAAFEIIGFLGTNYNLAKDVKPGCIAYERIKEAGVLDLWYSPVRKEEPTLEIGKWYKHDDIDVLVSPYEGDGKDFYAHGFEFGHWENRISISRSNEWKPAVGREIEEALLTEASKRYNIGDEVINVHSKDKGIISGNGFCYGYGADYFAYGGVGVFEKGQWAKVSVTATDLKIAPETKPEVVCGKTFEITLPKEIEQRVKIKFI